MSSSPERRPAASSCASSQPRQARRDPLDARLPRLALRRRPASSTPSGRARRRPARPSRTTRASRPSPRASASASPRSPTTPDSRSTRSTARRASTARRYAGPCADDAENNRRLLLALQDVPEAERTARFRCTIVFIGDDGVETVAQRHLRGPHRLRAARRARLRLRPALPARRHARSDHGRADPRREERDQPPRRRAARALRARAAARRE